MQAYGIYVNNQSSPTITGGTVSGNQTGIQISGDSGGTYQGITFAGNVYGINH
jgi:parallel beta-helix repeat protein